MSDYQISCGLKSLCDALADLLIAKWENEKCLTQEHFLQFMSGETNAKKNILARLEEFKMGYRADVLIKKYNRSNPKDLVNFLLGSEKIDYEALHNIFNSDRKEEVKWASLRAVEDKSIRQIWIAYVGGIKVVHQRRAQANRQRFNRYVDNDINVTASTSNNNAHDDENATASTSKKARLEDNGGHDDENTTASTSKKARLEDKGGLDAKVDKCFSDMEALKNGFQELKRLLIESLSANNNMDRQEDSPVEEP